MSSSYYTRVSNTTVSGSALLSSLTGADANALAFQGKLNRTPQITLTTANHNLTVDELVQATLDCQLVSGVGMDAAHSVLLGADVPATARVYIDLFNLSLSSTAQVLMKFQVSQAATPHIINIANSGSTFANVKVLLNNAAAAASQLLFAATEHAGVDRDVEVWATNVTSGSEVVVFNIAG